MPGAEFVDLPGFMIEYSYFDEVNRKEANIRKTFENEQLIAERIVDWITTHVAEQEHRTPNVRNDKKEDS